MSYHESLDAMSEESLKAELRRRITAQLGGLCDYCGRVSSEPTCRFPERHTIGAVAQKAAHIARHRELHANLDELLADFLMQTKKLPSKTPIMEIVEWSHRQCNKPTEMETETETETETEREG